MREDEVQLLSVDDVKITFFNEDPDGDPDRAGDGWYFQLPEEDGWDGPWHSEEGAEEEAAEALQERDLKLARRCLADAGFQKKQQHGGTPDKYAKDVDGERLVIIELLEPDVAAGSRAFAVSTGSAVSDERGDELRFEADEDGVHYGHLQKAALKAIAAAEELGVANEFTSAHLGM